MEKDQKARDLLALNAIQSWWSGVRDENLKDRPLTDRELQILYGTQFGYGGPLEEKGLDQDSFYSWSPYYEGSLMVYSEEDDWQPLEEN